MKSVDFVVVVEVVVVVVAVVIQSLRAFRRPGEVRTRRVDGLLGRGGEGAKRRRIATRGAKRDKNKEDESTHTHTKFARD